MTEAGSVLELQRLEALREYGVLDTPADAALDALTMLAATICDAPIALISFVDHQRQWFKSRVGLAVTETPRSMSFCSHAIGDAAELFKVNDTAGDQRFAANPLVLGDPHIRFYAGAPLTAATGHRLGTLCVIDRRPRVLTPSQEEALRVLSCAVVTHLELQRQTRQQSRMLVDAEASRLALLSVLEDEQHTAAELRDSEARLRQSQKMEAVGQLAGGVAHDFNNLLTVVIGQVEFARDAGPLPPSVDDALERIREAAERAANLTRQLLMFSRRQVMQQVDVNLNDVVSSITRLLKRTIGEDIDLRLRLHPHPLIVHVDPVMIDQVLMNLAINSRDAMPQGGKLTIETGAQRFDSVAEESNPDAAPGTYATVRVSDSGTGIASEHLPRIFDPFFTTKAPGHGTGLGLATVFGILKQHGGWVGVESTVGAGTSFEVFLPASMAADRWPVAAPQRLGASGGSETVLLVEDDANVRSIMRVVLERSGYRVVEVDNGEAALAAYPRLPQVDLLLTDLVMPGEVSGHMLARRLQAQNPDLKVLFTSGYSPDIAGTALELKVGENFVGKPFTPHQLLGVVRRALDG